MKYGNHKKQYEEVKAFLNENSVYDSRFSISIDREFYGLSGFVKQVVDGEDFICVSGSSVDELKELFKKEIDKMVKGRKKEIEEIKT